MNYFDKLTTEHILNKLTNEKLSYREELVTVLDYYTKHLSSKNIKLLLSKLQLSGSKFNQKSYVQSAVETSIVYYFLKSSPDNFIYEPKLNSYNNLNVECQIQYKNYKFNIEVKTPSFEKKEEADLIDGFKIFADGRYDNYSEISDLLKTVLTESQENCGEKPKLTIDNRRMDNNLKTFLCDAHKKFPENDGLNNLNCLFIGCGDESDLQNWYNYLYKNQGLFTNESFTNIKEYNNVDLVIFTDQYLKHNNNLNKNSWNLEMGLIFSFINPFKKYPKIDLIKTFDSIIATNRKEFMSYKPPPKDIAIYDLMPLKYYIINEIYKKPKQHSVQ